MNSRAVEWCWWGNPGSGVATHILTRPRPRRLSWFIIIVDYTYIAAFLPVSHLVLSKLCRISIFLPARCSLNSLRTRVFPFLLSVFAQCYSFFFSFSVPLRYGEFDIGKFMRWASADWRGQCLASLLSAALWCSQLHQGLLIALRHGAFLNASHVWVGPNGSVRPR